jgi:RNA polymerase sigma-70 factor, ECF subfamily
MRSPSPAARAPAAGAPDHGAPVAGASDDGALAAGAPDDGAFAAGAPDDGAFAAGAPDDGALARAAQAGRHDAILLIWDRHGPAVRGVLRRSLGPGAEVEDLVQEVFLRFHRNVGGLRKAESLRSFLLGIAARTAISELRRRKVRRFLSLTDDGEVPERAGCRDDGPRALTRLYQILDGCSASDRLAFVLRYVEGLELPEVAAALGVSVATAKRQLARVHARVSLMAGRDDLLSLYVTRGGAAHV